MARPRTKGSIDPTLVLLGKGSVGGQGPAPDNQVARPPEARRPTGAPSDKSGVRRKVTVELPLDAYEVLRLHSFATRASMTEIVTDAVRDAEGRGWPEEGRSFKSDERKQLGFWVPEDVYLMLRRRSYRERTTMKDGVVRAIGTKSPEWSDDAV